MLLRRDRVLLAIDIVLDVAFHAGRGVAVTGAGEIAGRLGAQRRGIESLLQTLTRAGLLEGVRGPRGGYRLARAAGGLPLREVMDVVAGADGDDAPSGGKLACAVTRPLWAECEALPRERLGALTIGDLLRRAAAAGLRRPLAEPLDFAI